MFDIALVINPNVVNIYYKKVNKFFIKGVSLGLLGKIDGSIQICDMAFANFYDANHKKSLDIYNLTLKNRL